MCDEILTTKTPLSDLPEPLLDWYRANARDLPWRRTRDPYRIWVSEIMLQQTRVAAVIPYYERWMEALPDVAALAAVEEGTLMKLWEGLGYYSRARNLQKAAKMIVNDLGGIFPRSREKLLALPGVGDYTAGAVASIAFGERVPAVDGNVLRLAARIADIRENVLDPKVKQDIAVAMAEAVPEEDPGGYNQALMDLGATVCLPGGRPLCRRCPLKDLCRARALGIQESLPRREKKTSRRRDELTVFVLLREGKVALRRRADTGLLAGLWEFPHVPENLDETRAAAVLAVWGLTPVNWREKRTARHLFTHVEWAMTGYVVSVKGEDRRNFIWADEAMLSELAIPSAFGKYLAAAQKALADPV